MNVVNEPRLQMEYDAYKLRMAGLEQLRALPLAPPSANDINSTLLACLCKLFMRFSSVINAAILSVLIWYITRLPPGSGRIRAFVSNDCSSPPKDMCGLVERTYLRPKVSSFSGI